MKKTLLTLISLVGTVSASVTTWDLTDGDAALNASGSNVQSWDVSQSGLTWNKNIAESLVFTVDAQQFNAESSYTLLTIKDNSYNGLSNVYVSGGNLNVHIWDSSTPNDSVSLSEIVQADTNTLTLVWNRTADNKLVFDVYADDNFETKAWTYTFTSTGANGFSFDGKTFQTLNFGGKNGDLLGNANTLIPSGTNAAEWELLGAGYTTGAMASAEDLTAYYNSAVAYNTASIPEPTTATLSLLALAGLAARRRRR